MRAKNDEKFPLHIFSIVLGVAALLLLSIAWFAYHNMQTSTVNEARLAQLSRLQSDIVYLDEVLTMSAYMAAKTGDRDWILRYNSFEPKLISAIEEVITEVSDPDLIQAIRSTQSANDILIKLERQAFGEINRGNSDQAWLLLSGAQYQKQKQIYKAGMDQALNRLSQLYQDLKTEQKTQTVTQITLIFMLVCLLFVFFTLVVIRIKYWNKRVETLVFKRTEKLRVAQQASKQAEQFLKRAQSVAQIGNWRLDLQKKELWWSDEIYRIFGLDQEKDSATYETFLSLIHPDDFEKVEENYRKSLSLNAFSDIEYRILRKDNGDERWISGKCEHRRAPDGTVIRSDGTIQDVTERVAARMENRKKDQQLRLVLENIPGAVVATDQDLHIVFASSHFANLYNVPGELLEVGAYYPNLLHHLAKRGDYGYDNIEGIIADRLVSLRNPQDKVFEDYSPDGTIFRVSRKTTDEGITITIVSDITELKKAKQKADDAKEAAEMANKAKSSFLASISHEIRTPMTGVMGYADLLMEHDLPQDCMQSAARIKGATNNLLGIVNDLLDISKLEAGKMEVEHINFLLADLLDEVVSNFKLSRKGDDNISLQIELADDVPKALNSDPMRIRQILINLVGNALKFTENGTITIRCRKETLDAAREFIKVTVSDTGIGISPSKLENLFQEFTQADASISRKYEGTGLGLSISKRLVELLGGEIGAKSVEGKGSDFWFLLPLVQAGEEVVEKVKKGPKAGDYLAVKPLRILLAEDNRINRQLIRKFIESYGHTVVGTCDGQELLESWNKESFDLILTDVRMPNMDGVEATRIVREKSDIPIIGITADALKENIEQYINDGMNACVYKPINWSELVLTINRVLNEEIHVLKSEVEL
ncbi:ATP-binding protein [Terasakiella sp. A23]|uniref:hybrid sensor histidine kinase/response regulator n=1 Tax=Terasakiella sp. FCG-A23 TaxID=3080561 RepID=UPI002952BF25|nr:ATP-binding protein [Terasakiella sp. A23]MDV7338907.1 ATP-binding protein [Terasakiella sp. A23]